MAQRPDQASIQGTLGSSTLLGSPSTTERKRRLGGSGRGGVARGRQEGREWGGKHGEGARQQDSAGDAGRWEESCSHKRGGGETEWTGRPRRSRPGCRGHERGPLPSPRALGPLPKKESTVTSPESGQMPTDHSDSRIHSDPPPTRPSDSAASGISAARPCPPRHRKVRCYRPTHSQDHRFEADRCSIQCL